MATGHSPPSQRPWVARRRRGVVEEALDHAVVIMGERGAAGLTVSEVARRMGIRAPSLYKYFASLRGMYDALFARGYAANGQAVDAGISDREPGWDRLVGGTLATIRWCTDNPALAQLIYWRPVPGLAPSDPVFEASVEQMAHLREEIAEAVRRGQLGEAADTERGVRLFTVLISGIVSQQMANDPGADFRSGRFTALAGDVLDMFRAYFPPTSARREESHADTGP